MERKKIEKDLGTRFAGRFNSVYEMVSFTHTPYAFAWAAMGAQDWLLGEIMKKGDYFSLLEQSEFQQDLNELMMTYDNKIAELKSV